MAYSKQTWVRGEKVASAKLNHMEDGIANAQSTADGAATSVAAIGAAGAIGTTNLANASVTNAKLDQEAVDSDNIRTGAIITPLIYDGAVTKAKIDSGAYGAIASVYDNTKTYDVGDYVIYNNDLYRCTTAITTAEAWTAAHWTAAVLGDDVADLKSAFEYGAIVNYAQKTVFSLMREINEEIPPAVIASLSEAEEEIFPTYAENDFLIAYYSDNHMFGFETGVEVPITALAIKRFDNHMDFDSILCCGDSVLSYKDGTSPYVDDGSAYTALEKANFMLDRQKLLFVEGNHDRNINSPVMTTQEFINLMYRPLSKIPEVHFGGAGRPYFYRDYEKHKIRIICLDLYDVLPDENYNYHSGYKQNQMEWLANTALNVPDSSWHVLVATHAAPYGESDGMTNNGTPPYNSNVLIGILESFKNGTSLTINSTATITEFPSYSITTNFSTAGNLIGCFVGHNHVDVNLVKNGIHYVSIECAYVEDNDKANRNAFEYSAIAFDVVVINTTNRSVAMHRVGYGSDRNYTY